jgi:hypothetical protein
MHASATLDLGDMTRSPPEKEKDSPASGCLKNTP